MRVLYVTQWFPPEPVSMPLWIADALRRGGLDVRVLTGLPHLPRGELFPGYGRRLWQLESQAGFRVLRVPEYPSHNGSAFQRALTLASFAGSAASLGLSAFRGADVAVVYSSPATSAIPAMTAKLRYGTPYMLVVQDLWQGAIANSGLVRGGAAADTLDRVTSNLLTHTYRLAERVVVISPGMKTALVRLGVDPDRISVVYNAVDEQVLRPVAPNGQLRELLDLSESDFILLYAGTFGEPQGLGTWMHAVARVSDERLHFALVGSGNSLDELRSLRERLGLQNRVHFLPLVAMDRISELAADADLELISLRASALHAMTIPSKIQSAFARARPVVVSVPGDAAQLVQVAGAGWTCVPDSVLDAARALRSALAESPQALRSRGSAGREYYVRNLSSAVSGRLLVSAATQAAELRR
jgi:glycosyltransferase involved in cell wall biosynthesis